MELVASLFIGLIENNKWNNAETNTRSDEIKIPLIDSHILTNELELTAFVNGSTLKIEANLVLCCFGRTGYPDCCVLHLLFVPGVFDYYPCFLWSQHYCLSNRRKDMVS